MAGGGIPALRKYQLEPARAIIDSVLHARGHTFTVEMSRQAGKNEVSAQIETAVLSALAYARRFEGQAVELVKVAPTFKPQCQTSIRRLKATLTAGGVAHRSGGNQVSAGRATCFFMSAEPEAMVVGQTANPLLEVDEAQDIGIEKFDRDFRPMGAAFNATVVFYGTAWDKLGLLHRERLRAQALERKDGIKRSFVIDWRVPAAELPLYRKYVEGERERLGPAHPLFTTQYDLVPLARKGRLFTKVMIEQLSGEHEALTAAPAGAAMVGGLDLAGGDDEIGETRDRTVLTIGAVTAPGPADPLPENHVAVLALMAWQGVPHEVLLPQLIDLVKVWKLQTLTVDATGMGEPTARALAGRCRRTTVVPLKFTRPSKSELGFGLMSAVQTGRLKMFADDGSEERATFWQEIAAARAEYLPGEFMNFYVDATEGHDDFLMSLALLRDAGARWESRVAAGRRA